MRVHGVIVTRGGGAQVQHAGLRESAPADISTIQMLVNAVRRQFPRFDYQWLVDEVHANARRAWRARSGWRHVSDGRQVRTNLPRELDFENEGKNAEECAHIFKDRPEIAVPRIIWPATRGWVCVRARARVSPRDFTRRAQPRADNVL